MTKIFAIFCLLGISTALFSEPSQEVNSRLQAFTQAFNQGNKEALSAFWTQDAEVTRPLNGETVEGKEQILNFLEKRAQELNARKLKFSFEINKIDFPEQDKAVIQGVSQISGDQGVYLRTARKVELVQQNGKWLIDSVSDIEVPPPPPVYTQLQDLAWAVGNWKDTDEDVTITFSNRWDKFKNFIISHFTMKVYDLDAMEGTQIIGWNPSKQAIESWVFDSDGGFGTGTWEKKGDSWEVALDYTLSDGKSASATNIYKKIDNNSYSFASKNRKVNGEAIPDVEPVTVTREEP